MCVVSVCGLRPEILSEKKMRLFATVPTERSVCIVVQNGAWRIRWELQAYEYQTTQCKLFRLLR